MHDIFDKVEQIRDYMIFEEETSKSYPFAKRYDELSIEEKSQIIKKCANDFDTETIHESIGLVVGFD